MICYANWPSTGVSSRNTIGRNPSMVIPLLANQDFTPMLTGLDCITGVANQRLISWLHAALALILKSVFLVCAYFT